MVIEGWIEIMAVDVESLVKTFAALRRAWFDYHLRLRAHEREWESEEKEEARNQRNEKLWEKYHKQTIEMVQGTRHGPIAPRSPADLDRPSHLLA